MVKIQYATLVCLFGVILFLALSTVTAVSADGGKPGVSEAVEAAGLNPVALDSAQLKPGLSTVYYKKYFERTLEYLPEKESSKYPSVKGRPILQLNHQFGKENVFDSGTNRGVGIRLEGYISFEKSGMYMMQALSNDGVRTYLDGQKIIDDSEQHSDRLSNVATITITEPGWYPVKLEYFQRKGTATLKLMWKTPDSTDFTVLPASVYAHVP